jgi:hypothetical protein
MSIFSFLQFIDINFALYFETLNPTLIYYNARHSESQGLPWDPTHRLLPESTMEPRRAPVKALYGVMAIIQ